MTKTLTTIERINNKAIFNKYFNVVRNMTVADFHHIMVMRGDELYDHYDFNPWRGYTIVDAEYAVANLLLDDENISVTRYKRLVA
jgi:hypothetical protein